MKTVLTILCCVLGLALLWQVSCNTPKQDPHVKEIADLKKIIAGDRIAHISDRAASKRKEDSLTSRILVLEPLKTASKSDFEKTGRQALKKNTEYKQAVTDKDTSRALDACAEISKQLDTAEVKYAIKEAYADSLETAAKIQHIQDTTSLNRCLLDYDRLFERTEKLDSMRTADAAIAGAEVKKAKRTGLIGWLVAALSIVAQLFVNK